MTNSHCKTTTFTRTLHVQKQAVVPSADKGSDKTAAGDAKSAASATAATGASVLVFALVALAAAAAAMLFLRGKEERN